MTVTKKCFIPIARLVVTSCIPKRSFFKKEKKTIISFDLKNYFKYNNNKIKLTTPPSKESGTFSKFCTFNDSFKNIKLVNIDIFINILYLILSYYFLIWHHFCVAEEKNGVCFLLKAWCFHDVLNKQYNVKIHSKKMHLIPFYE